MACGGRLFRRRAAATGNTLSPTVDWTDEYVECPVTLIRQNIVVVWLQSMSAGRCSSSRRYVGAQTMLTCVR